MQPSTSITGLSASEVSERLRLGHDNRQTFEVSRSLITILRTNLLTLFNGVVGGAFLLLLILGQWQDALFGLAVLSNVIIGIVQEYRSKRILDRLAILNQSPVRVRRDGLSKEVRIEEVVLDDVLEISRGDQLPADAKLLQGHGLEIDESLLTGEAEPVIKTVGDELLSGSGVTGGNALALVIRVGADTYSSKLVGEARQFSMVASELRQSLNRLILWISWALAPIAAIVIHGQLKASTDWLDAVVRAVASIISMVPQGLVLITSVAFGIAAIKLARQKVLLQELAAVEGLARVDVICFDKTGTLTDGAMQFDAEFELPGSATSTNWRQVAGAFAHQPNPNATMLALQKPFPATELQVVEKIEFNSERKFSSLESEGSTWLFGAPEVLTEDPIALAKVSELSQLGRRSLLLSKEVHGVAVPIAILSLKENVHTQARQTFDYFKAQGVEVRLLSGDNAQTVASVAREAGLQFEGDGLDARSLPTGKAELANILETNWVLGRVTPDQKRSIVEALQEKGHVVAMIGDGVNDAPALRKADLGIAMGSGSPVTKAAANLVLLQNQLDVLPSVVAEGRRVIGNVERLSSLFLTKTSWAMILAVVFGVLLWEYPVLPRQLSAIDGFAIGIPALLLALLPNNKRYEPGFLGRSLRFCIPAGAIIASAVIALGITVRLSGDWSDQEVQTATSIVFSITGLWVLSILIRPWSGRKLAILGSSVLAAIAIFTVSLSAEFFAFSPLDNQQLLLAMTIGAIASAGIELVNILSGRAKANAK